MTRVKRLKERNKCIYHLETFFHSIKKNNSVYHVRALKGKKCDADSCNNDAQFQIKWLPPKEEYWMTFKEAKSFIRKQKISRFADFQKWAKSNKRPENFPSSPYNVYRYKGWTSWPDFLGRWATYEEARQWARKKGLKSFLDWRKYVTTHKIPNNIPKDPRSVYINHTVK